MPCLMDSMSLLVSIWLTAMEGRKREELANSTLFGRSRTGSSGGRLRVIIGPVARYPSSPQVVPVVGLLRRF